VVWKIFGQCRGSWRQRDMARLFSLFVSNFILPGTRRKQWVITPKITAIKKTTPHLRFPVQYTKNKSHTKSWQKSIFVCHAFLLPLVDSRALLGGLPPQNKKTYSRANRIFLTYKHTPFTKIKKITQKNRRVSFYNFEG
jgi:hypothetical protein